MIRRLLQTHALSLVDQGVSSATNFVAVLAVARVLGDGEFGVFAMAYTALTLFLGVGRSFFGVPIALAARESHSEVSRLYRSTISGLVILAVPIGAVVLVVGLLVAGGNQEVGVLAAWTLAIATPLVLAQDVSRYFAIAVGRPAVALWSDSAWLVGMVLLLSFGSLLDERMLLVFWVAIIVMASAIPLIAFRPRPSLRHGLAGLRLRAGLRESLAVTVLLSTGITLVMGFMALPFLGAAAVGSLRGAGTLFGPVNTLLAILDFSVLAQLARRGAKKVLKPAVIVTVATAACSGLWAVVLLVLPESVGLFILGDTWVGARAILPFTALEYVFLCVAAGLSLLLKLRDRPGPLLVNRVLASVVILTSSLAALLFGGSVVWLAGALLLGAAVSAVAMAASVWREYSVLPENAQLTNPPVSAA